MNQIKREITEQFSHLEEPLGSVARTLGYFISSEFEDGQLGDHTIEWIFKRVHQCVGEYLFEKIHVEINRAAGFEDDYLG